MAITTLDGIIAGFRPPIPYIKTAVGGPEAAGIDFSTFYLLGNPANATAPSPGVNGAALTTYAGQVPFTNPAGGSKCYLGRLALAGSNIGSYTLADRLWHNSGLTVTTTTAQAITSPTWPARDLDGATAGRGIMVAIEVRTATTNAGAITNTTLNYTNSAGTAGRTGTIASFPATAVAGTWVPFQLQADDVGIRSIQGITLGTSYAAGAIHLVAYRPIADVEILASWGAVTKDAIQLGLPEMFSDSVPFFTHTPSGTAAVGLKAQITYTHG